MRHLLSFTFLTLSLVSFSQQANDVSSAFGLVDFLIYLAILLIAFLLNRFVLLWYFKINKSIELSNKQISLLESIDNKLETLIPKKDIEQMIVSENEESLNSPEVLVKLLKQIKSEK